MLPSEVQFIEYATLNVDSVREVGMIQRNENWKQAETSTKWHQHKDSLIRNRVTRDMNQYHNALGHSSEAITCATAHAEGTLLKGYFNPCEDCSLGKARQANVFLAVPRSTNKRERTVFDISSPLTKTMGGKQHWLMVVDDCKDYCWRYF